MLVNTEYGHRLHRVVGCGLSQDDHPHPDQIVVDQAFGDSNVVGVNDGANTSTSQLNLKIVTTFQPEKPKKSSFPGSKLMS